LNLLNVSHEVPPIFHKSIEELNDEENFRDETEILPKPNSPEIQSSESGFRPFSLATNNINKNNGADKSHKRPMSLSNIKLQNAHKAAPAYENIVLRRVKQQEYQRTISHDIQTEVDRGSHRRTQSYGFSTAQVAPAPLREPLQRLSSQRQSTREYYAAPQFTEAQVVERNESMMHRRELETFIDILDYQASSPDEKALVEVCARLGIVYLNDNNDIYTLRLRIKKNGENVTVRNPTIGENDDEIVQFKRLQVLEFTSDRKRMSVIVMDKNGQIWLYTKGAESHVLPLCSTKYSNMIQQTNNHINDFAKEGLRTLAVARKKLSKSEFINFNNELIEANSLLQDRAENVEACQRKIENGLELLGATAVEDALQDDVRDTLVSIRAAGIKVWVLTGDKIETALNIALACGHIPEYAGKYFITECQSEVQLNGHLEALSREIKRNRDQDYTLLIDGSSLSIALQYSPIKFRDVAYKCHAVLCCRLSPLQKCEVVHLVKSSPEKPITAAIGDGANDVSMIQEAHVGLGIFGKEGRQAARCADYAFANFSMLKRLLLYHGHYFSQRLALLVLYFFYKNVVFMGCQLFFQMHSMFSTQSIYDSLFLTLFNVTYTTLPILFISITEQVHTEEKLLR
jgi:phospholipid-translocating ATPase